MVSFCRNFGEFASYLEAKGLSLWIWTCGMNFQQRHAARPISKDMQYGQTEWTSSKDMRMDAAWKCGMNMKYGHVAWKCDMGMRYGHAAWMGICTSVYTCMDMYMYVHVHIHVQPCPRFFTHTCTYILKTYCYVVQFYFIVSPNFLPYFAETKWNMAWSKWNFGEILRWRKRKNSISGNHTQQCTVDTCEKLMAHMCFAQKENLHLKKQNLTTLWGGGDSGTITITWLQQSALTLIQAAI
jgi:hypothetical protein